MTFSREFKRHLKQSLEMFLLTIVVMLFGIALTFIEEWCETHKRPTYVTAVVGTLSAAVIITDALVVLGVCIKLLSHLVRDLIDELRRN